MRTMLLKLLPTVAMAVAGQAGSGPVDVPYRLVGPTIAVDASVGGHKRLLVLDAGTVSPEPRAVRPLAIEAGGHRIGEFAVSALRDKAEADDGTPVDGKLGLSALRALAVGVDIDKTRVSLWPKGGLDAKTAEAWVRGSAASPDAPVVRLDLIALPDGELGLPLQVGDKQTVAAIRLQAWGSYLLPPMRATVHPFGLAALVSGIKIAGKPIPWLLCPKPDPDLDERLAPFARGAGSAALLALDSLSSPRVLVDFAAKAVYARQLSIDERLTGLMRRATDAPVTVQGDHILVAPSGTTSQTYPSEFAELVGREVLSIAGKPASEWLGNLRNAKEAGAERLAQLLDVTQKNYSFVVRDGDGDEQEIKVRREG